MNHSHSSISNPRALQHTSTPEPPHTTKLVPSTSVFNFLGKDIVIPWSDKAHKSDKELKRIEFSLCSMERPPELKDHQYQQFIKKASGFFILEDRLWKHDLHGKHKIVIPENKCLELICEAHDNMGHKGLFSVRARLLDRLWWPMLEHDVKWYVRTCHECQV